MSLFTRLLKKSLTEFFKKYRVKLLIAFFVVVLLSTINILINNYVDRITASVIKEMVYKHSDGFYVADHGNISYVINKGKISLKDFRFRMHPDIAKNWDPYTSDRDMVYEASIPELHLIIKNFWILIFERRLEIIGLEIQNPDISITDLRKKDFSKKISLKAGDFYKIISKYLKELKINDFSIIDGKLDHSAIYGPEYMNIKVNNLSMDIKNILFTAGSEDQNDKLRTDDVTFRLKDQRIRLKDNIHTITFDDFLLSTRTDELMFTNLNIFTDDDIPDSIQHKNRYNITIPGLHISGIDFVKAYTDEEITIKELQILDPEIDISKHSVNDSLKSEFTFLSKLFFDRLQIENFRLQNASINYLDEGTGDHRKLDIDNVSVKLDHFDLAPSVPDNPLELHYENIDVIVHDYSWNLSDSVHVVTIEEIGSSSNPLQLYIKNLKIQPLDTLNPGAANNLLYAKLPFSVIDGLDLIKAINEDTINVSELYLESPELRIAKMRNKTSGNEMISEREIYSNVYTALAPFVRQLNLKKINLIDGRFSLINRTHAYPDIIKCTDIDLEVDNFMIDSTYLHKDSLLVNAKILANIGPSEFIFKSGRQQFKSDNITYKSNIRSLSARNIRLHEISESRKDSIMNVRVKDIFLEGFNINQVLKCQNIDLGSVTLNEPEINVSLSDSSTNHKSSEDNLFRLFTVHSFITNAGKIKISKKGKDYFKTDSLDLYLSDLRYDPSEENLLTKKINIKNIESLSSINSSFNLTGLNHQVSVRSVTYSGNPNVALVQGLNLKPAGKRKDNLSIHLRIPSAEIIGWDIPRFFENNIFETKDIILREPFFQYKTPVSDTENKNPFNLKDIPRSFSGLLKGVELKSIRLENGNLEIRTKTSNDSMFIETRNIRININDLSVTNRSEVISGRFMFSDNIEVEGDYFSIYHRKKKNFLNINRFDLSTKKRMVKGNGFYFINNTGDVSESKGKVKITFEDFNLLNLDFHRLVQEKRLVLGQIRINQGKLDVKDKPSVNTRSFTLAEYPFDSSSLKSIDIKKLSVTNFQVNTQTVGDRRSSSLFIPDMWVMGYGIKLDADNFRSNKRLFYTDELSVTLKNLSYKFPDNLNSVRINEINLNTKDSSVHARNFALIPLVKKYDLGPVLQHQQDWIRIENKSVEIQKIDFDKLLNQKGFFVKKININELDAEVFRDKRYPFKHVERRLLPQELLRTTDFPIRVDSIELENGFIKYQEHAKEALSSGEITFTDLNAIVLNISNQTPQNVEDPVCYINADAKVMGIGKVNTKFRFYLNDPQNKHEYSLNMGDFDLTEMNRILQPNASVKIKSGFNKSLIMTVKANEDYSIGEMRFYYDKLKVVFLNRETETQKGVGNIISTFFANTFIINSNNPHLFFMKKGDVFYERNKEKSIFNYLVKSFFSGVISSIGAKNNKKEINKMYQEDEKGNKNDKE